MEPERHKISILAVEDDETVRRMLGIIINRKFPDNPLYFAENGNEGIELFKAHNPEIVITDIIMPEMDGVEMASTIKTIRSDIKLIVITGYNNAYYHEKFRNIGANAFLSKPIDIKKLFAAIEMCFAEITDRPL
ncbi:MAG TPA: response regulator [Dongiaceae bacterium]|nr:response regulator [Dongiaceae bacterium]